MKEKLTVQNPSILKYVASYKDRKQVFFGFADNASNIKQKRLSQNIYSYTLTQQNVSGTT